MRSSPAIFTSGIVLGLLLSSGLIGGCAACKPISPAATARISARTRLLSGPTAAITVGEPSVIAVDPQWGLKLDGETTCKLDDGRTFPIAIYWASSVRNSALPGWIADFGPWSTLRETSKPPATGGVRLLTFALPTDAIGQGIWLGGKRIDLQWIPSAEMLAGERAWTWTSRLTPEQRADTALHRLIAPEATNPLTRWRFRLLTEGLAPAADARSKNAAAFDDPQLESWARQIESIWRLALRKVQSHDPAIAASFVARLTQIITFPDGASIPMWAATDADLLGLAEDLAHQSVTPQRAAAMVEAWIESQPVAAAWVQDDAAGLGIDANSNTPVVLSSAGMVNLAAKPALATLQAGGPPELARMEPDSAIARLLTTHPPVSAATLPEVHFQMLDWDLKRSVVALPVKVAPPGIAIGPMIPDWTMPEFLRSDEASLLANRPADIQATLSFKGASVSGIGPESLSGWTLVIISLAPASVPESFTIYFGPAGKTSGTLRVTGDSAIKTTGFGGACQTRVTRLSRGWGCEISLPSGIIDKRGRMWLAVATERQGLGRASWPRPQFPWQVEPGRIIIDTTSWGGLTADPSVAP